MRLVKEHVLTLWEDRKADAQRDAAWAEVRAETIRQKLDRVEAVYVFR